jgi:hypothetical protein
MIAQIAAIILALAKALPAIEQILTHLETARANTRAAELHNAIDDAVAQARREACVCPRADCPVFVGLRRATQGEQRNGTPDATS